MKELLKNINDSYNVNIENIHKLGVTTINDIFVINSSSKKYIVKIYNVDEEKQIKASLCTQKKIYESLGIVANVLENKKNELYTKYNNKFYAIQEYIEEQNDVEFDKINKVAKSLLLLHKKLREFDESKFKDKKEYKGYIAIKQNIEESRSILRKTKIEKEVRYVFDSLLNKRENILEKYKCEYNPKKCQVIHRDIRPGNIIFNKDNVYFIDFDYIAYGDLLFEIGSAAMLISNFEIKKAKEFIKTYNLYSEGKYTEEEIFKNLLEYYVQSDFPIKLINKVENKALIGFIENRIKCLEFCEKIICK